MSHIFVAAGARGREGRDHHVEPGSLEDQARIEQAAALVFPAEIARRVAQVVGVGLTDQGGLGPRQRAIPRIVQRALHRFGACTLHRGIVVPRDRVGGLRVGIGNDHFHLLGVARHVVGGDLDFARVGRHIDPESVLDPVDRVPGEMCRLLIGAGFLRGHASPGAAQSQPGAVLVDEVRDHPDHDHAYREIDPLCHNLKSARTVPARASLLPCFACQGSQTGKSGSAGGFSFLSPSIKKPCLFSGFGEKPCNLFPDVASMYVISRGFPKLSHQSKTTLS